MARYENESETSLLRAARRDPAAFTALYRRLVVDVHDYLRATTRDADLARDLTAETFARTLESLHRFRGLRAQSGRIYVFRIAQRLVAEQARARIAKLDACRRLDKRLLATLPDGSRLYAVPSSGDDLCLAVTNGAMVCGRRVGPDVPIMWLASSKTGQDTFVAGLARDDVRAVEITIGGRTATVSVTDNTFWYRDPSGWKVPSSFVAELADGSRVDVSTGVAP